MTVTSKLLKGHTTRDSIDALYYAVRYFHQPELFSKNPDAVFVDAVESLPSEAARELTRKLLHSIEERAGRLILDLSVLARKEALDELLSASKQLNLGITPAARAAAQRWIAKDMPQTLAYAQEIAGTDPARAAVASQF